MDTRHHRNRGRRNAELNKKRIVALKKPRNLIDFDTPCTRPSPTSTSPRPPKPCSQPRFNALNNQWLTPTQLDAKVWVFHPGAKTGIGQFYPGADWNKQSKHPRTPQNRRRIRIKHRPGESASDTFSL